MRKVMVNLLAVVVLAGGLGLACQSTPERERATRQALFEELQPIALENCTLSKIGGDNDTGYLMCKNLLEGLQAAYSYGTEGNDDWGCDISTRYHVAVHQYDCTDPARPSCPDGKFDFHAECMGASPRLVNNYWYDTLDTQIKSNKDEGKRIVLKMDIEGGEWDALMGTPDDVLARIDQLPIEFHGVNERRFLDAILKLKKTFYIANLHFNNFACAESAAPMTATAYQVLFVNKRIGVPDKSVQGSPLPSIRNVRDNPLQPDCQPEIPDAAARVVARRQALLDELHPVALRNCTLARYGSRNDGGYLMCQNLVENLGAAYSYGVGPNDEWGCDVSTRYKVPVHQYDCFDPARPTCSTGTFVFHNECLAERTERSWGRDFDTLTNQIARNGDSNKRLIVKIDIEGAEWDSIMATPDEELAKFDQMPMELHGIDDEKFLKVLQKLKKNFYLVNLHFNNFACNPEFAPIPGVAYQVLFVNKRIGILDESKGLPPPSPLNAPDNPNGPDCPPAPFWK
jgi:hypothetical protein